MVETGAIKPEVACRQLTEWCLQGSKLDLICTHFGEGSLFFLGRQLSVNFVSKDFSGTGNNHDGAFAHLTQLGLAEKTAESGANELGKGIRQLLSQPFRDALARSSSPEL